MVKKYTFRRKFLMGVAIFLLTCVVGLWGIWFAYYRPIIPKGEIGELQFEKVPYYVNGVEDGAYDIGVFFVPENRSKPNSRTIAIDYVRFHAKEKKGPPVFLLPGGPGNTYIGKKPGVWKAPYIEKLRVFSDVVFVNQRGYNPRRRDILGSWRKETPNLSWSLEDRVSDYKTFAQQATDGFKNSDVDLSGYNIIECAADVDDLRKALGYDKIMLMGQSFGSQWCFAVMRKHSEIVERAILTGVEPLNNAYDMPSHVMNAVRRIWKHLDNDPAWAPFIPSGGMEVAAQEVLTRLENGGITIKDARTNETKMILGPEDFPWNYPGRILELYHGQTKRWVNGRGSQLYYARLIFPLIDSSIGVTPDRLERLMNDPDRRFIPQSNSSFAAFMATFDIWPSPDVGDAFRNPVESDIPVLFLHGDWDRHTPIENTHEIAPFFPNSHTLFVERGGHAPLLQMEKHPEVMEAIMVFAKTGSQDGLPDRIIIEPELGSSGELPNIDPQALSGGHSNK